MNLFIHVKAALIMVKNGKSTQKEQTMNMVTTYTESLIWEIRT